MTPTKKPCFRRSPALAALLAMLAAPLAAHAEVLQSATTSVGNQAFPAVAEGVGLDFHVNSPITVTALGIFDSGADGIAGRPRSGPRCSS